MARGASFNAVGCHVEYTYHGMARVRTHGMHTMRVSSFFGSSQLAGAHASALYACSTKVLISSGPSVTLVPAA